ncbi:alpha/beta hydrolase [Microbispora sp. KK1-11]|uniref:alpha/beta hydrolase n=1 Tax=Microbispora sp. KK1-11 TaxID=2053005 RepID=UPI00115AEF42|nr:alpha/beta hydrolase [Microbispora sp. KK1-11]TQS21196.1 alpha/beta hydrolase [Microbispora sp. KK1-11]
MTADSRDTTRPAGRPRRRGAFAVLARLLVALTVLALAPVLGLASLAGLASVTTDPAPAVVLGLAVFASVFLLGLLLFLPRPRTAPWRRVRAAVLLLVETFVVVRVVPATFRPFPDAPPARSEVAGRRYWDLPTGSHIAYVRLTPKRPRTSTPVVFLHGGPGVADMKRDAAFFGALTSDGYVVYVYDQVGAGSSGRLADPRGYGLARDVADLDAIRQAVGAEQMILIGHSYGAQVAAAYLAHHTDHVAKAVFSSPGSLTPSPTGSALLSRLDPGQGRALSLGLLHPRALAAYTLVQVNPQAAHALVGDDEMDARFARYYELLQPALHCRGAAVGRSVAGLGAYANLSPQASGAPPLPDLRSALAATTTPALVLKGSCDYLSWSSAAEYRHVLRGAELVYLRHAGHDAYQDQPGLYMASLRAFLAGRPVPEYEGDEPPADYEGPR